MTRRTLTTALLLLATAGCGSSADVTGPTNVTLQHGSMSVKIDGQQWTATTGLSAGFSNGILAAAGVDGSATSFAFGVAASGPGTYTIGPSSTLNAILTQGASSQAWSAVLTTGSGTLTINSLSATGASGTFSFTVAPNAQSGASGNRTLTEGRFDLTF